MTNDDDIRAKLSIWWTSCSNSINKERADALVIIERLINERDEARRIVCGLDADLMEDQREYARQRGWDCFDITPNDIEAHEVRGDLSGGNP